MLVGNGTFSPTFLSSNFTSMLIFISSTLESVLTKEFDRLKDNYHRCIRKREKMTRSGCAGTKLPTCEYFVELSILFTRYCDWQEN